MGLNSLMGTANHGRGAAAEHSVAALFLANGYEVWWPSRGQSRADFVLEKKGRFWKVQVKTATWERRGDNEYLRVRLEKPSRGSRAYLPGDFDLLVATDGNRVWSVGFDALPSTSSLCLDKRGPTVRGWGDQDPDDWRVK